LYISPTMLVDCCRTMLALPIRRDDGAALNAKGLCRGRRTCCHLCNYTLSRSTIASDGMCLKIYAQYLPSTCCRCQSLSCSRQRFWSPCAVGDVTTSHACHFVCNFRHANFAILTGRSFEVRVLTLIVIETHSTPENPCSPILPASPTGPNENFLSHWTNLFFQPHSECPEPWEA